MSPSVTEKMQEDSRRNTTTKEGDGDSEGLGEKCVRTIVEQLEIHKGVQKAVPRIIESKCIEKTTSQEAGLNVVSSILKAVEVTVNSQSVSPLEDKPQMKTPPVTVNNHISFYETNKSNTNSPNSSNTIEASGTVAEKNANEAAVAAKAAEATKAEAAKNQSRKVCRNKNVDLAFTISNNGPALSVIGSNNKKGGEGGMVVVKKEDQNGPKATFKSVKESIAESPEPVITSFLLQGQNNKTDSAAVKLVTPENKSVDLEGLVDENNRSPGGLLRRFSDNIRLNQKAGTEQPKEEGNLIKWTSLSKFDEKFYVTNDVKLKHKKKYDEMEFEEFEVYDPNNECYDSLNSNT